MPIGGEGARSHEAVSVHTVGERLIVHAPNLLSGRDEQRVAADGRSHALQGAESVHRQSLPRLGSATAGDPFGDDSLVTTAPPPDFFRRAVGGAPSAVRRAAGRHGPIGGR